MLLIWWVLIASAASLAFNAAANVCDDIDNPLGKTCELVSAIGGNLASIASCVLCIIALVAGLSRR